MSFPEGDVSHPRPAPTLPGETRGPAEAVSAAAEKRAFRHFRNFDVLRLLAASSVIFSHGYYIAKQGDATEPFKVATGEILGTYGVFTFFIISGLLVTESWTAKPGAAGFLWRRFLRIVPGFTVCMVLSYLVVGAFFFDGGLLHFVHEDWKVALKHLVFRDSDGWFPGVHFYPALPNHQQEEVNGSVWTLQQELICYLLLALFASARWHTPLFAGGALLATTYMLLRSKLGPDDVLENFCYAIPSFASGVLAWWLARSGHRPRLWIVAAALGVMALGALAHKLMYVFPPCMAYIVLYVGVAAPFDIEPPRWFGDLSYGTYLYGWPVQQLVRAWAGPGVTWPVTVFGGLLLALLCAYASWWLVERPALKLKGRVPANFSLDRQIARLWDRRRARRAGVSPAAGWAAGAASARATAVPPPVGDGVAPT